MLHKVLFYTYYFLQWPQYFCFFHFVRITDPPQIKLRKILGIPISFTLLHLISNPFLCLYFRAFHLSFKLAFCRNDRMRKREKNRETRTFKLQSHTVRALCPYSEKMRWEKKERERKKVGRKRELKEKIGKKMRIQNFALLRMYGVTSWHQGVRKPA